ncbi:MAG TPA: glycosyltransferase [Aquabacterium sp.]|nr:glycosyltransferase [Aquabacterium sp.]
MGLRVLQLGKFYPPVRGGIETVIWELAEGLTQAGLRSDVLCSNQRPVSMHEWFPGGYEVVRAGSFGRLLSTSMAPAMVLELARLHERYDLVHIHMPDPMAALAVWMTRPAVPLVVHWHSDVIRQRRTMKLYEPLQHWLLQRADAIVTTSEPYARTSQPLQAWRHKVEVIPIGVSDHGHRHGHLAAKTAAIRHRFAGRRIIFSLGRMAYYKGYDVLIDAATQLPDDCVVVIGGDGELLQHYQQEVDRRGIESKVCLLGHVSDDDLPAYFDACDIYCMTSTVRAEAYGVAMVEAMAHGRPVVATDIEGSGVPWVNVDGCTGFNMPVGQPGALVQALKRLLGDAALRERLGQAARQRFLCEFNASLMTRRTAALYERLRVTQARKAKRPNAVPAAERDRPA